MASARGCSRSVQRPRRTQQLATIKPIDEDIGRFRLALGGVPVLSMTTTSIRAEVSVHRVLEENPAFRSQAATDHDRCRCREPQRVRACDDDHGDREEDRGRERSELKIAPGGESRGTTDERRRPTDAALSATF